MTEYLMCAKNYRANCHDVRGWLMSEKLNGWRCFSDGGTTRGLSAADVPWSTVTDRDIVSTGLWTRSGNVINAPEWFLDRMPPTFLDGELWTKRDDLDRLKSICKKKRVPVDAEWQEVKYVAFDVIPIQKIVKNHDAMWFRMALRRGGVYDYGTPELDTERRGMCLDQIPENAAFKIMRRQIVSLRNPQECIAEALDNVNSRGGEGLVVRDPQAPYVPGKSDRMLKIKKLHDTEGVVVGHVPGKARGSIVLDMKGNEFKLGGLPVDATSYPIGTLVTFQYESISVRGIPQHARFLRVRKSAHV